ncbi:MAG TPA: uroporphyrinogen decarboxylase family protein [Phycisphaerae bacterium]|nr:uroporphyrinogen decarboxylase family protein [Phycisphaerae bacterium]
MTPRENTTRTVEFRRPERLAVHGYGEASDSTWIGYDQIKPPAAETDETVDQWLCRWAKTDQPNMGQVKGHPLEDLSRMKDFPWPDGNDPRRYETTRTQLEDLAADPLRRDRYGVAGIFMILWERMHSLHGFENCMIDLIDDRPEIHELADRILQYDIEVVRSLHRICGDRVQGFNFSEDWGTQIDLHISPELWTKFFFPRYRKLFRIIHECGWHVWMHSCGKINKAIPGLIEAGLDVINMQQPRANGIDEIGRQFAGRICFETLCDIQATLPKGDRAEITAEAAALMRTWGTRVGGFVLGDYGDHHAIGADPEVKQFMLAEFRRQDPWKNGW